MKLSTRSKLAIAALAYRAVHLGRGLAGLGDVVEVQRGGVRWRLDLAEGIDLSIWLLGAFEPATVRAYRRLVRPGATVLDVGANVGAHTLPLAELVGESGRVIAIEPTREGFAKLAANLALNPLLAKRVDCRQMVLAAAAEAAPPEAIVASWPLAGAEATDAHGGRAWSCEGARVATLDQLCAETGLARVDLIKLDVDGAEPDVLRGAEVTLGRDAPDMVIELAPYALERAGESLAGYVGLLTEHGYRLFDQRTDAMLPNDPDALGKLIPANGGLNVIARTPRRGVVSESDSR